MFVYHGIAHCYLLRSSQVVPLCPCVHLIYHLAMIGQEGPDSDEPIKIRSCILLGTTVVGSDGFRWHLTLGSWCPYSHPTQRWFKILLATASSSIYGSDGFRWIQLKPGGSSLGNSKHQQLDRMASYAQVYDIIHIQRWVNIIGGLVYQISQCPEWNQSLDLISSWTLGLHSVYPAAIYGIIP